MHRLIVLVLLAGCVDPAAEEEAPRAAPATSWEVSQATDTARLVSVDPGADWGDFAIRFDVPGQLDRDGRVQAVDHRTPLAAGPMAAGDRLSFCTDDGGELSASLSHTPSNSRVRTFRFSDVQRC